MATPPFVAGSIPGVPTGASQGNSAEAQKILAAVVQMLSSQQQSQPQGGMVASPKTPQLTPSTSGAPGQHLNFAPPQGYVPLPNTAGGQASRDFASPKAAKSAGIASIGETVSNIVNTFEQREQQKKSAMAENYMMQINSLISSGDPGDRQKAMMFLEDPKIRKTLKTGLDYVPLEEPVPPEAQGVQSAIDKIKKGQIVDSGVGQPTPPGQKPPPQKMQPVLPQPSQSNNLQAMITNALMQKGRQDPSSLLGMAGASQLSGQEQKMAEFYEKGLGMSPAQLQTMSAQEKMEGLKMYEGMIRDYVQGEMEVQKAQITASAGLAGRKAEVAGRIDVAKILAGARTKVADIVNSTKSQKGAAANYAAGSKMYEDLAKTYAKLAETPGISSEQKDAYQKLADQYSNKADDFLNQQMDDELIKTLMGPGGGDNNQ